MIKLVQYIPNTKIPNPRKVWLGAGLGGLECVNYFAVDWDSEELCDLVLPDTCLVRKRQDTNKCAFLFRGTYTGKLHPSDNFEILHGKNRYIACFGNHVKKHGDGYIPTGTNYYWETALGDLIDGYASWCDKLQALPITNLDHLWPKPITNYIAKTDYILPDDFDDIISKVDTSTYWAWTMAGFAIYAILGDAGVDYFLKLCDNQDTGRAKYDNIAMTYDPSRLTGDPIRTLKNLGGK